MVSVTSTMYSRFFLYHHGTSTTVLPHDTSSEQLTTKGAMQYTPLERLHLKYQLRVAL